MESLALCAVPAVVLIVLAFCAKFLALILVAFKDALGNEEVVATGEVVCDSDAEATLHTVAIEHIVDSEVVHYPGETIRATFSKIFGENG